MARETPKSLLNSEWLTRKKLIDGMLASTGWRVVPFSATKPLSAYDACAIEEYPTENGPADYALCVAGKILGIVEAKKLSLGPQNVLVQAERYSRGVSQAGLAFGQFGVPFLYSTNGETIWHHDVRQGLNRSRTVQRFHTPQALREFLQRDFEAACQKVLTTPNAHPRLRPYQREANAATEKAIAERKRHMLLAMATGTGKTFTMVNQIYRLMKAGVGRRILFLVDRRALAAQAVRAFASFEAEQGLKFDNIYELYSQKFQRGDFEDEKYDPKVLPSSYLLDPQPGHAFVYVSTIQRMAINLFGRDVLVGSGDEEVDDDADRLNIPIHSFDLIVADECHRGYTSSETAIWRRTLDHFDAIKVGLTATPAAHTTSYFKDVVFRYEYERAVREGYLVDYDVVRVKSSVRLSGMFLKEGEQVSAVDPETGSHKLDALEDERQFDTSDVERKVTSPDSNRKILEEIKRYADEHEKRYGRFPKTLIFAVNDLPHTSHADQLVDTARDVFGRGEAFVQKITGSPTVDRPLQRIREFRNRPQPGVVVTVDMLSTGVDIPDLEFIVFLRPVKSRILFEQMLGRGTRKGEQCQDKSHFTVFDCFDGSLLEYFRDTTGMTIEPPTAETRTIVEVIEDIWRNRDREYNIRCLSKRLQRIDKEMSAEARELFAAHIPDGDVGGFAAALSQALQKNFTATMDILRGEAFQDLLLHYPRRPRVFYVALENQDDVSSAWLVRGLDGKQYKPQGYITAFTAFVKANESQIEAIRILLSRPQSWSTEALTELYRTLAAAPQRFTMENLQKAHQLTCNKALADIISMVKHAANEQSPLLTAAERVDAAIAKVTADKTFTPEQQQWLQRIRAHLQENLTIDKDDFDTLPVFSRFGGWGRAKAVFGSQLPVFIKQINEAVAA